MPASGPAKVGGDSHREQGARSGIRQRADFHGGPGIHTGENVSRRPDPMRAITSGGNEQLGEGKRGKEHRRVVLAEGAQLGIGGHADDLEDARLFAASGDFGADGIVVAEQAAGQGLVENDGHGVADAIGNLEIATAQDGDAENAAELLAAAQLVGVAGGGKRVVAAAHGILRLQFAHERQGADGSDAGGTRHFFDKLHDAIAPSPTCFALTLPRRLADAGDHRAGDIESGVGVGKVDETADK